MREIEFRIYYAGLMYNQDDIDFIDFKNKRAEFGMTYSKFEDEDFYLMQYTGLKDKNGVKIFEGDLLRIKHKLQDKYYTDSIYSVRLYLFKGIELKFEGLFDKDDLSNVYKNRYPINQYPISQYMEWDANIVNDWQNKKYDNIAIKETYNDSWQIVNNYSNDIEVIGNVHENKDLLP